MKVPNKDWYTIIEKARKSVENTKHKLQWTYYFWIELASTDILHVGNPFNDRY
ncbi:MAG: hypothetical protein GY820_30230 [Gammaproteobacteria bacterium]|nr:hypothetical protein [Gammaproteobacteria bacterium]